MSYGNSNNNPPPLNIPPGFPGPPSMFPPGINPNPGATNKIPLNGPSNPQVPLPPNNNFGQPPNLVPVTKPPSFNVPIPQPSGPNAYQIPKPSGNNMGFPLPPPAGPSPAGSSSGVNPYQGQPSGMPPVPPGIPPVPSGMPPAPPGIPLPNQAYNQNFPQPTGLNLPGPLQNMNNNPLGNIPPVPNSLQSGFPNIPNSQFPPPPGGFNIPPPAAFNKPPPQMGGPGNFNMNPGFGNQNMGGPSISLKSNINEPPKKQKKINCTHDALSLIFENDLQKPIENKYNAKIDRRGLDIVVSHESDDALNRIEAELKDWIKKFTFDDGARWAYLENDGSYRLYDQESNEIIEQTFRFSYYQLITPGYKNYSKSVEINAGGVTYVIEFSYIGGVHRQKRKNVHQDTIRAVKRQANNEDINSNYVRNYKWLWKHESGQFRPYEDDASFLMENAFIEYQNNNSDSIALIQGCNGKTYKIDLATMTQFNEITNFKRPIRRETV